MTYRCNARVTPPGAVVSGLCFAKRSSAHEQRVRQRLLPCLPSVGRGNWPLDWTLLPLSVAVCCTVTVMMALFADQTTLTLTLTLSETHLSPLPLMYCTLVRSTWAHDDVCISFSEDKHGQRITAVPACQAFLITSII